MPLFSEVAESDTRCKEFIPEVSSSNEKASSSSLSASSKIYLTDKINVSNGSKDKDKDSTSIKSQPVVPVINNYTIHLGDVSNSILQFGDQNEIKYDKPEECVEDDTTYEIETVPEVLENRSSSKIDIERSPDPQNISGRQRVEQSIADDAYRTSNMLSTNDSILRSAACERTDSSGNQALLKTSVTSEIECSQHIEETTSNNNLPSYSTNDFERLGIDLRHNRNSEGENRDDDDGDDETCLKKTMSDD